MQNKRGQGLSTNAIILIILAVVVLVVLIMGFTLGWSKLAPWLSKDNVQEVVDQCNIACSTNAEYAFCAQNRTITIDGEDKALDVTCERLSTEDELKVYGVEACGTLCPTA